VQIKKKKTLRSYERTSRRSHELYEHIGLSGLVEEHYTSVLVQVETERIVRKTLNTNLLLFASNRSVLQLVFKLMLLKVRCHCMIYWICK
jgi:hypothetical protein